MGSLERGVVDSGQLMMQKRAPTQTTALVGVGGGGVALGNGHFENWGDSGMADTSQQTDTSTGVDTDDKNQVSLFHLSPQFIYNLFCFVFLFCENENMECPDLSCFFFSFYAYFYMGLVLTAFN